MSESIQTGARLRKRYSSRAMALMLVLSLGIAACGDSGGDVAADSTATAADAATSNDDDTSSVEPDSPERAWAAENIPNLDPGIVDAACDEGNISLYLLTFRDESAPIIGAFEDTFPCLSVESISGPGGALSERFTSEARAGRQGADIWMNTSPAFANELVDEGLLAEYEPPNSERVPDAWKREGYWYSIGLNNIGVAYNDSQIDDDQRAILEGLSDWSEIVDPAFEDDSAVVHIRAGGTMQVVYYMMREQYGEDFWPNFQETLQPTVYDGINPAADRLVAGDFAMISHAQSDTAIANRWAQGAPLKTVIPEPGIAIPYFMAVAEDAPSPNAARLFVAWSLSAEAQEIWSMNTGLAPVNPDIEDNRPHAQEDWYVLPSTYWDADYEGIANDLDAIFEEFEELFGRQ